VPHCPGFMTIRSHAHRSLRLRTSAREHRAGARRSRARSARMLVVQGDGRAGADPQPFAELAHWLEPGDQLVVKRHQGSSRPQLKGRRIGRETEAEDRGNPDQAARRARAGRRWSKPRQKRLAPDMVTPFRFGNEGKVLPAWSSRRTGRGPRAVTAKSTLSFRVPWPRHWTRAHRAGRPRPPLPPYIASKRTPDEAGCRRLPETMFRSQRGARWRPPTAGPAFHASTGGDGCAGHGRRTATG